MRCHIKCCRHNASGRCAVNTPGYPVRPLKSNTCKLEFEQRPGHSCDGCSCDAPVIARDRQPDVVCTP